MGLSNLELWPSFRDPEIAFNIPVSEVRKNIAVGSEVIAAAVPHKKYLVGH